ncbi:MAG TPA: hypothetical protein PLQ49_06325 [Methanothrix sp.]|nr:hypothetical protein [Methanothrix sp.]
MKDAENPIKSSIAKRAVILLLALVGAAAVGAVVVGTSAAQAVSGDGDGAGPDDPSNSFYEIMVNLPAAEVRDVVVNATHPEGLIYDPESLETTGSGAAPVEAVTSPNDGTKEVVVTWDFGDVDNSNDADIMIRFRSIAADVQAVQDGATLPPLTATLSYVLENGETRTFSGEMEPVTIVEPDLAIAKRPTLIAAEGGDGDDDDSIAYSISIFHSAESHSGAFDVDVVESLPAGLVLVPGSARIASGPAGSVAEGAGADGSAISWHFDEIDSSWAGSNPIVLEYRATIEGVSGSEPAAGLESGPTTDLAWTSTPGDNPHERSYSAQLAQSLSDLVLTIDCDADSVVVGKTITFTYSVDNLGLVSVSGLNLTDDRLGSISLDATDLAPGETVLGQAEYTVSAADLPGPLSSNATVTGTDALGGAVSASGTISIPFGTDPLAVKKTALNKTVSRGDNITYKIEIYNSDSGPNAVSPTKIVVEDVFNRPVEFVSASPRPDADGLWRYDKIDPGKSETITLVVKVPEEQDFNFSSESGVSGSGFVNVADDYSTSLDPYPLTNCVYVSFLNGTTHRTETVSDCETVTVLGEAGTELSAREHGSGTYESADLVELQTETDRISFDKDMAATAGTTSLGLYRNRTVTYSSRWTEATSARNRATGASISEAYRYATTIDRESSFLLNENESAFAAETEFDGMGHISFLKMPTNSSTFKATPVFESREDYAGSFRVVEKIDEYGKGASSEKQASGEGVVAVDKRIGESQRTYEHGSGTYEADEIIETYTNYIAKKIYVSYSPNGSGSSLWEEGISSRVGNRSLISEEYSGLTELEKDTIATGLNQMDTTAAFSGTARYRTIYDNRTDSCTENDTDCCADSSCSSCGCADSDCDDDNDTCNTTHNGARIDFDETYSGDFEIERHVLLSGAPKYDRPHLSVTKTLDGISEVTEPWGYGEVHLEGEEKIVRIASYTIRIENDGDRAVAPVYVTDLFPPGAGYRASSLRPTGSTAASCNWTLTHLAIGDVAEIEVELDVTRATEPELTNRVEVCGGMGGGGGDGADQICASNFSSREIDWLTCCTGETVSVKKTGEVGGDGADQTVVWYRIEIKNDANATRVATVTDHLPEGMVLLDSMVPFASYDGRTIVWNLEEIGPGETATIAYRTEAVHAGRFVNSVQVDARSVDGPAVQPVSAKSVVQVGEPSGCESTSCDLWSPPAWDFEYVGYYAPNVACEEWDSEEWLS